MTNEMMFSYQTRLVLDEKQETILQECACLFSHVEHCLYKEVIKGKTSASCKNDFLKTYGITARQFNAVRVSLDGKIAACKEGQKQGIASLKQQIISLNKTIQKLENKSSKKFVLHQKKRRLINFSNRLSSLEKDYKEGRVPICFGGKKLFRAQHNLEKNGFSSHQEWLSCWQGKRSSEFFVLGSKDETGGNQSCVATVKGNSLSLRLRLPRALEQKYGKYLTIDDVSFSYGHDAILASLNNPNGQALSYRFKKDEKGFRVFVSTALEKTDTITRDGYGAIGVDINIDHIAYAETDRFGNPVDSKKLPWVSNGKSRDQLKAITGDLCKILINKSIETKKPLVIEKLDFQKKKLSLKENCCARLSRNLSSFAYGLFFDFLKASAYKHGVTVHEVNPAYTSTIGRVNYAKRYGLSVHCAAALCIARRHQKFSENPCSPVRVVPDGKGGQVTFVLPVRDRTKHVWHFWGQVNRKLKTVLAAHFKAMKNRSTSPPESACEM